MKLNDDSTAETIWTGPEGEEWQVRITFDFHKGEKQTWDCPGEPEHVEIINIERMEPTDIDVFGWMDWNNESDSQCEDWAIEILEAINADDRGNEP